MTERMAAAPPFEARSAAASQEADVVVVEKLSKHYQVSVREPGFKGTVRHLLARKTKDTPAVKEVSFRLARGEIVGFLGPNGAGKTTTLKMLTGLVHPTGGRVQVCGHTPFSRKRAFLEKITLVMGQKQQLLWDLPAMDSLRIQGAIYDVAPAVFKARVGRLSEMLDIGAKLSHPVRKLSLGERMKCELLTALIHEPEVLFLDEPTLGLDVNAQSSIREFLQTYNEEKGATILLTSHYMADITALCSRVLLIHEGTLGYDGPLDALVAKAAPHKEVKVELETARTREELAGLGQVLDVEGKVVRFAVPQEALTQTVSRLLSQLPLKDLTVSDPPIEEVIGKLFRNGARDATSEPASAS